MTCGVCLCEYDVVDRKPKFLPCAHTFCLLCLKKICEKDLITCPFCRETSVLKSNVESLPNNPYALHMLKFKENGKDTLKRKMEKSIELYDEKQCETMAINSEDEFRKKVKIAIHLFDENDRPIPIVPFFENGFRAGSEIQQDSLLVSHAVFSLLKHQKIQLQREEPTASAQQPSNPSVLSLPSSVHPMNKFVLDNLSIFKFRIFRSGYLLEEMVVRPELSNFKNCDFLQKLGEFCFKSQQVFCSEIYKAVAGLYGQFPMRNTQFKPSVPKAKNPFVNDATVFAHEKDEIGIQSVQICNFKVHGWRFIFPLENFKKHVRNPNSKALRHREDVLFGRVISRHKMETVSDLSSTSETRYTITLESQ